jgi:hypothetical protein
VRSVDGVRNLRVDETSCLFWCCGGDLFGLSCLPGAIVFNDPLDEGAKKQVEAVSIQKLCAPIRQVAMLRLSRPGAKAVQVIPPLQGLELDFKCKACSTTLFQASSVLRHMPGKSPIVSRDLSWMYPKGEPDEVPLTDGDDASGNADDVVDAVPVSDLSSEPATPSLFAPPAFSKMPLTTPKASSGRLSQKSKSFAVRSGDQPSSFDPFDFGSGVPPTPSNRKGCASTVLSVVGACGLVC